MDKKYLYLEGASGISGDMFVGAMIDLGADLDVLADVLDSIPADGFGVEVCRVKKAGIDCVDFDVILDEDNHDHDMAYLYGGDYETRGEAELGEPCYEEHGACEWQEQGAEDGVHSHEEMESISRAAGGIPQHSHGSEDHHYHHEMEMPETHDAPHAHDHDGVCVFQEQGSDAHSHEDIEALSRGEDHNHEGCCGHHHGEGCCHHHHEEDEDCGCGHHHEGGGCCHHHHDEDEGCGCGHHHEGEGCCHHHHHHEHRNLADVQAILDGTEMTDGARRLANQIFLIVAQAESKAHRLPLEEVHFHEVGAVDSIVDIISAAVCFDNLGITDVIIPSLSEGTGTVRCQHGILPVPVPATLNIAESYGLSLNFTGVQGEFVTPTGAAIAAALRTSDKLPAHFKIVRTGCGAGKREYTALPGFLRAMIIDPAEEGTADTVMMLETDIDDSTGEALGYLLEKLMAAGARDAHYAPVFMKKNRPAWELTVICDEADMKALEEMIFAETTTIGIREIPVSRAILPRELLTVATPYGEAAVKRCTIGGEVKCYPEYEAVKRIAEAQGMPFAEAYKLVKLAAEEI